MKRWEIRAIQWLTRRLRDRGAFRLRFGHSLALVEPDPELYMEVMYGAEEVVVFTMTFTPQVWPKILATMSELHDRLEREYEDVTHD